LDGEREAPILTIHGAPQILECLEASRDRPGHPRNALDHVVVVLFENRSLDNMLAGMSRSRLYRHPDGRLIAL
jgi:phospholipase C